MRTVFFLLDGDTLPLSQPQSAHGTLVSGSSCPGTPEMRRRQEEVLRRLASQVPTNTNIMNRAGIYPACHSIFPSLLPSSIDLLSFCLSIFFHCLLLLLICSLSRSLSLSVLFSLSISLSTKVYYGSVALSNIYMQRVSQHSH